MLQKGFSKIIVIVIVLVIIGGIVLVWQRPESQQEELNEITPPIMEEDNQPPAEIEPPIVEDEIINWQSYQNEEYRFEVQYPQSWKFVEYPTIKTVGFAVNPIPEGVGEASNSVSVSITQKDHNLIVFETLDQLEDDAVIEDIMIDGILAVKISGTYKNTGPIDYRVGLQTVRVLVGKKPFAYVVIFDEQAENIDGDLIIFDQMLSTFKFID